MRNPTIADLLSRSEYIEKMGTGIKKIRRLMSEAGLKPPKFKFGSFFTIIFQRPKAFLSAKIINLQKGKEKGKEKSTEKILRLITENPLITTQEIAKDIGLSSAGVEKAIRKLKQQGQLRRIGPDKGGHWEVIK